VELGPRLADPRVERLLQRLQSTRGSWYLRGQKDGEEWAVDRATREELEAAHDAFALDVGSLVDLLPQSFSLDDRLSYWVAEDSDETAVPEYQHSQGYWRALEGVDKESYLQGWWGAVRELWETVSSVLPPTRYPSPPNVARDRPSLDLDDTPC
jgi:hypothetical protein